MTLSLRSIVVHDGHNRRPRRDALRERGNISDVELRLPARGCGPSESVLADARHKIECVPDVRKTGAVRVSGTRRGRRTVTCRNGAIAADWGADACSGDTELRWS